MPRIASVYESKPERLPPDFTDVLSSTLRDDLRAAPLHDENLAVEGARRRQDR